MLEVHSRLHTMRGQKGAVEMSQIAKDLVEEGGELFYFDEMNVTDIGDAVILRLLFQSLIDNNAILILTSNRPPKDLYKNGLQRDLFVPCIHLLENECDIHDINSQTDYRLLTNTEEAKRTIISPNDAEP
eukprot:UN01801